MYDHQDDAESLDELESLEPKWYTTPCLLLLFTGSLVISWQLAVLIVFTASVIALVWQIGPEWLQGLGMICMLIAACIKNPILMSLIGIGLLLLYIDLIRRH